MAGPAADRPGTIPPLTDEVCMMPTPGMTWRGDRAVSWIGGPGHRAVFNTYLMPNDRDDRLRDLRAGPVQGVQRPPRRA